MTSDNGSPPDIRGRVSNLPLRGFKHELWEGGVRVPALVIGEGAVGLPVVGAAATSALWHSADWLPTLLVHAAGTKDPSIGAAGPLDGVDQWSTLIAAAPDGEAAAGSGGTAASWPRQELLHNIDTSASPVRDFFAGLRTADGLKYVAMHDGTELLFNVTADPTEAHDLAASSKNRGVRQILQHFLLLFRPLSL